MNTLELGYYAFFLPFVLSLLVGTFYFRLFLLHHLGSCHCQTLSSVCSWRKGIDGAGTTSDSVPNFSEPIDFTFHEQAFTLLVGSSGSGKSSLFQMIAQVSSLPYSGQVLIDGREVSQLSIIERVQTVGILFQNPNHQFTMESLF